MKSLLKIVTFSLVTAFSATSAFAQDWPQRPIRMLVGANPGGGTDIFARAIAEKLGPALNTSVVVENRPGASNTLAADVTARSTDGHTMVMGVSTAHAIAPHLINLSYDGNRDLIPVVFIGAVPNVLVVNNSLPAQTVRDLVALAKSSPGSLNFASSGAGSTQHIAAEIFREVANIDVTHIPYRGSAPALADLMGGRIQFSFDTLPSVVGHIQSNSVRPLAVASSARNPQIPNVPTMGEAGFSGVEMSAWYGIYMPASTPQYVQDKVHSVVNNIISTTDVRTRLESIGASITPKSQQEFKIFHMTEFNRYGDLIRRNNIRVE